jgi:hypothetical protein
MEGAVMDDIEPGDSAGGDPGGGDSGSDTSSWSGGDAAAGDPGSNSSFWPGGDSDQTQGIQANFCYVSNDWAKPNTTIAAKDRDEADKRGAGLGLVFCHTGACTYEGKFEPLEEGCG